MLLPPVAMILLLGFATGFRFRDLQALVRHFQHRQEAAASVWKTPESQDGPSDFALISEGDLLLLRDGALGRLEGGTLRPFESPQGALRFFQEEPSRVWVAGTYHRLLSWNPSAGLQHCLSVRGTLREVRIRGERLVVGFEENELGRGLVKAFHQSEFSFEPEGDEIPIGMDRWSGFDLSPDGRRILANVPGGRAVGVWSLEDGRLLASWPTERLARILHFVDDERILFERGPELRGREAAYACPANRLLLARVQAQTEPVVIAENFATVLSSVRWSSRERMAFADMEGLVRVVDLGSQPRVRKTISPRDRGIPWKLRAAEDGLWVLLKGEEVRLERFTVE
jgi:hypothetical protein